MFLPSVFTDLAYSFDPAVAFSVLYWMASQKLYAYKIFNHGSISHGQHI